ncbi:AAA family ATPase [Aureimonas sp. AU40]|uniref:AAA family ATPase n=1 Tax=Aureimonas sp. AU40 TaxID=1637747 RepID=UPI000780D344|nr:AAA family ATPase [Aureimonas sp. AU40]
MQFSGIRRLVVLTGGPGGGKTTLVEALAARGFRTVGEAGRAVIRAEEARGGTALPWGDRAAFAARMAERDETAYRAALEGEGTVIFDRALPDTLGYLRLCGLPEPKALLRAVARCRYRSPVFLAPFWPAIFSGDAERRQDAAEAAETAHVMRRTYEGLGYEVIDLPLAPVAERVRFLRQRIGV